MSKLIIVSGSSGAGKNTLVDAVIKELSQLKYLEKALGRDSRPNDRPNESSFPEPKEIDRMKSTNRMILPYKIRGYECGIPVDSLTELKEDPRIICTGNYDLIRALKDTFDTTSIYVKAPIQDIKDRLKEREDTPEQKQKSIDSVKQHLLDYEENKDLFDYEINNGDGMQKIAQNAMIKLVKDELSPSRKVYDGFLLGDYEYDNMPLPSMIRDEMKSVGILSMAVESEDCKRGVYQFTGDSVGIRLSFYEDKERKGKFYGRFKLEGVKDAVTKTAAKLEKRFPALSKYGRGQERINSN